MGTNHRPGKGRVGRPPGPNSTPASRRKARRQAAKRANRAYRAERAARQANNEPAPRQQISTRRSIATGVAIGAAIAGARIARDLTR